jgi:hypothetical protein
MEPARVTSAVGSRREAVPNGGERPRNVGKPAHAANRDLLGSTS